MKKFLILIISVLLATSVFAQTDIGGPHMTFEKKNHDFGDVKEGDKVTYVFKYKNTGTDTLKVDKVISSCGCTVPENYDRVVAPGASGSISVEFNSANKMGVTNKTLTILSNAKSSQPAITISIRANVISK